MCSDTVHLLEVRTHRDQWISGNVTRLVDRLEQEGLIARDRSGPDRRATYAVLTLKGFRAFRRAWPIYAQGILKHFVQHLTEQELSTLSQMLARVVVAAQESSAAPSLEP